ncbi:MAG: Fe-S oxidoreductase [Gammaproteobacteria bacterium]|nr:Fe-S oxidoreductase [Gammaproteobacteria bacterium]MYD76061.1 Fe-S oxidoreductase [Gammaproteobacteria bacterium]MYJ51231.1 Fe-S oxidoreductase [Gammaproteobacteria bacterium]
MKPVREGSLEAPTRHPLDWKNPEFHDQDALFGELERVYDLCHGCRRCVSLCNAFPTLFDLVDESPTMEMDGVERQDYWKVVDQCYLCDLCYQTKCPYIPPHEWNIDFPHLMLRAKAVKFRQGRTTASEKILSSTDAVGKLAGIPVVVNAVNAANRNGSVRKAMDRLLGVHPDAAIPEYHSDTLRRRMKKRAEEATEGRSAGRTTGKVALFATCYANYSAPDLGEDLIKVLEHNGIAVTLAEKERCCGMPKLELGDLESVERAKDANIPVLKRMVDQGWDIMAPVPSCILMFRQELPLMFPDDDDVATVAQHIFDPFEYLILRHREGCLKTDFPNSLGKVAYHVACHQRVQKIGQKTKECLELVPGTEVMAIERCSGHDGTYGVKTRHYDNAKKIARPVANRVRQFEPAHHGSDCPMAGRFIAHVMGDETPTRHPISMIRQAYGI